MRRWRKFRRASSAPHEHLVAAPPRALHSAHAPLRRLACQSTVGARELDATVAPLQALAEAARDVVQQVLLSFDRLRSLQSLLATSVKEYLAHDALGIDEPTQVLLQTCWDFFDDSGTLLDGGGGLHDVGTSIDQVLQDCEHLSRIFRARDESFGEVRHYAEKVARLRRGAKGGSATRTFDDATRTFDEDSEPSEPGWPSKLSRNIEKLHNAEALAETQEGQCRAELKAFNDRRTVHSRVVVRSLLQAYTRLVADWGRRAGCAAGAFSSELRPGTTVTVVGLPETGSSGSGACTATVEDLEEGTGRCLLSLEDGLRTAVRAENLRPVDGQPKAADITLAPAAAPCGFESEAEVHCGGLDGPIAEVIVGGAPARVLAASSWWARIVLPPCRDPGDLRVEARTAGWRQRVAFAEGALRLYEPVAFGACGANVRLMAAAGAPEGAAPAVAARVAGLLQGVVLTASPLPQSLASTAADCGADGGGASWVPVHRHYFEVEALEVTRRSSTRTASLGFAWPLPGASSEEKGAPPARWTQTVRPAEMAKQVPRTFVVGGDLPRAYLGGKELGKVSGWRPLLDVVVGSVLGALLEVDASGAMRLTVLQDGVHRCTTEAALPGGWIGPPHGVVDVCGTLQRVQLRQGAELAEPPTERGGSGEGPS